MNFFSGPYIVINVKTMRVNLSLFTDDDDDFFMFSTILAVHVVM